MPPRAAPRRLSAARASALGGVSEHTTRRSTPIPEVRFIIFKLFVLGNRFVDYRVGQAPKWWIE